MSIISARLLAFGTLVTALIGSSALAQNNGKDLLKKATAEQSLLTQKLEAELRKAVAEARRLQATSPVRAANALRTALSSLEDPLIPESFRNQWTAQLNTQIRQVERGGKVATFEEINPLKREMKEADIKRAKAAIEEFNEVKRSVDTISALMKAGNTTQAQKEIDALAKRYPDNPAALVMTDNMNMNNRLADARVVVEQQKQGYMLAMRSVDKAAIPPKDDIEYNPERWREITKLRNKPTMTKKEQELLKALDSPINLGYKDAPFQEVIKSISTSMGQNILLDKSALEQAMIESNTPVSINLRGVATRSALRQLLQNHNLTYIIKDESIQVVTPDQARATLMTRVYYLGDLIRGVGAIGGAAALEFGPLVDMMQMQDNANRIIEMIKAIDPLSWKENGGNGSVVFNFPSMSVIVRQTAEFHGRFGGSLGGR